MCAGCEVLSGGTVGGRCHKALCLRASCARPLVRGWNRSARAVSMDAPGCSNLGSFHVLIASESLDSSCPPKNKPREALAVSSRRFGTAFRVFNLPRAFVLHTMWRL